MGKSVPTKYEQEAFIDMCEAVYALTQKQRKGLLDLLQSRIWLYDLNNSVAHDAEFERIYEFDERSLKCILRDTSSAVLSYALKGVSQDLFKKFSRAMPKTAARKLGTAMEKLGPIRLSERIQAQEEILETIHRLAASGEIECSLPLPDAGNDCVPSVGVAKADPQRAAARVLLTLPDYGLRTLGCEIPVEHWSAFLWYFDDARLRRKAFAFSSPHLAKALEDDFALRWHGVRPESATKPQLDEGRKAMRVVLKVLRRLADEGQVCLPGK